MTEDDARARVVEQVGGTAFARLERLAALIVEENGRQNLVAPASIPVMWSRHMLDSTQLLRFAPPRWECWIDIGTGGGFPGLAVAACCDAEVILVEPRRRRAAFLEQAASVLRLGNVRIEACKIEQVCASGDVISARAVASIEKLLPAAIHCATSDTVWILPRGRIGDEELQTLGHGWRGVFHVELSMTDPMSGIVIARGVAPR